MYCYRCGKQLPDDGRFCMYCGADLSQVTNAVENVSSLPVAREESVNEIQTTNWQPQDYQASTDQRVLVNLRKEKGYTVFAVKPFPGYLEISEKGVKYTGMVQHGDDHSYAYRMIESAELKMTHAGVNPLFAYHVTLKSGTTYIYTYSPFLRSKINAINATIQTKMKLGAKTAPVDDSNAGDVFVTQKENLSFQLPKIDSKEFAFSMKVVDTFTITGLGLVVTGEVESGHVSVGSTVQIADANKVPKSSKIIGGIIIGRNKAEITPDSGEVGLLLKDCKKWEVCKGDYILLNK